MASDSFCVLIYIFPLDLGHPKVLLLRENMCLTAFSAVICYYFIAVIVSGRGETAFYIFPIIYQSFSGHVSQDYDLHRCLSNSIAFSLCTLLSSLATVWPIYFLEGLTVVDYRFPFPFKWNRKSGGSYSARNSLLPSEKQGLAKYFLLESRCLLWRRFMEKALEIFYTI